MKKIFFALAVAALCTTAHSQSFETGAFTGHIPVGSARESTLEITSIDGTAVKATLDVPGKTKNNACYGFRALSGSIIDGELNLTGDGQPLPECAVTMKLKSDAGKLIGSYEGGTGKGRVELSK